MPPNYTVDDDEKAQPIDTKDLIVSNTSVKFSKKMKKNKKEEDRRISGKLTVFQKLCFGVGGLPYEMTSNCLGLFLPTFMLEIAGLRPRELSLILFYGKFWDAITDPAIGYIVSKTNTKWGKLRPWIIFFAPFAVISYMMIWYVPDFGDQFISKVYWYLGFYCLFQTFLSCLHVPYTSLTMYLTHNQKERDSATGYRMGLEVFGVFLAATIQGIVITIYGTKFSCKHEKIASITNDTVLGQNYNASIMSSQEKDSYNTLGEGYMMSAGIMSIIYVVCCITTFFGTKEIDDVITDKNNHFVRSLGSVFRSKAYITLLLAFLFNSAASKHSIKAKDQYQLIIICLLVAIILSMPIWQCMIKKFGKKVTYGIGLVTFIPNLIPLYYITDQIWFMYIITIFCGFSMASHFLLPWSMLPDVIDEYMIRTGDRKESIFYSFFVFFAKFSSGISAAFSQLFLEYSGYLDCPNGCCTQPDSIKLALRQLLVHFPVTLILISLMFLYMHPINETIRKRNKVALEEMRSKSRDALITTKD